MFSYNEEILHSAIDLYKENFSAQWKNEKYKWVAIKCFQDNWDIDAADFADMLEKSLSKTANLLASVNNFPAGMIVGFAKSSPEEVRMMFKNLYDENIDYVERILSFKEQSQIMLEKYASDTNNHYQHENAISVYLWLRYPDKYYIYKFGEIKAVSEYLQSSYLIKKGAYTDNLINAFNFYNELNNAITEDEELLRIFNTHLNGNYYNDPKHKTLTIDLGFYISRFLYKRDNKRISKIIPQKRYWIYSPGENARLWERDYTEGTMSLGWDGLGDYSDYASKNDIVKALQVQAGDDASHKNDATAIWQFANEMQIGDIAFAKRGRTTILGMGTVIGEYEFDDNKPEYQHIRKIEWTHAGEWEYPGNSVVKTLTEIKKYHGNPESLVSIVTNNTKITYLSEIISALTSMDGIGSLSNICEEIKNRGKLVSINTNSNWRRNVSAEIQKHCKESKSYIDGNEDLFYSVDGIGKGIWGLKSVHEKTLSQNVENFEAYSESDFLNDVYISKEKYELITARLKRKKNIILQGAPGVGKTYAAKRLAYSMMGYKDDRKIGFIQFHQNYSYEDFIMGYKPNGDGFELKEGIFYKFCINASNNPDDKYFFIIDEINRGNLSKIFGELLMLIEKDYRGESAILAYTGKQFSVPENIYIIGLMNTADRSLALIDYALRRRFGFIPMMPAFNSEQFEKYQEELNDDKFDKLISVVKDLNKAITDDDSLGEEFCIGHSYFCAYQNDASEIVEFDIIPTLEEYWIDDKDKLKKWSDRLKGAVND